MRKFSSKNGSGNAAARMVFSEALTEKLGMRSLSDLFSNRFIEAKLDSLAVRGHIASPEISKFERFIPVVWANLIHSPGPSSSFHFLPVACNCLRLFQKLQCAVEHSVRESIGWVFLFQLLDQLCPIGFSLQQYEQNVTYGQFLVEIVGRGVAKKLIDIVKFHRYSSLNIPANRL